MRDTQRPVRTAFYKALNGNLTFEGSPVPIADEQLKKSDNNNFYVILSSQTATPDYNKSGYDNTSTITLDIVSKQQGSVSKDIVDTIADQILQLIFSRPGFHSLPTPSFWQFLNLAVDEDRHDILSISDTDHVIKRTIRFSLRVVQN